MYTVIGLGGVGCRVAKSFSKYPQYNVVCIDDQKTDWYCELVLQKQEKPEDYEESVSTIPNRIKEKVKDKVIVVVSGSSMVSSSILQLLYQVKDKSITILYVQTEIELLTEIKKKHERMVFSVLQEYARSGRFKEIILVSNSSIDNMIENASIKEYYPAINELISSTYHMIKVFENQNPVVTNFSNINVARRVASLGVMDMSTAMEKEFYSMSERMDVKLYYGICSESLKSNTKLQREIIDVIKSKNTDLCKYSYGVYETKYDHDFCCTKTFSSKVQQIA
tara:strand:- start:1126 stop:1965 length:840 start_codon:yes stop_codon:yes gene_type:complete